MDKNPYFTGFAPVYLQFYELLREQISSGVFSYQSRFPSKRLLAERYGISLVTVEHSLSLLCDEGYLEPRERSGYFVIFRERDLFVPHSAPMPRAAPASAVPGDFPFSVYARTMRRVITEYGETLLGRVPSFGAEPLRNAIASYLARSRNIRVIPDRIVIGAGSEYLYGLLVQFFGNRCRYAIENPSYEKIEQVYRANGADPELLSLGSDGIRSDELLRSSAEVLHITPYRSYPTGISTSASKRREYIRWADERNGYIIEDDFESEFTLSSKPEETVFSLAGRDNVLYLNSFTKTISPSVRIAYMLLPAPLADPFREKLGFYSCPVPAFEQYVLAEFIESGEFERHLNRVRRKSRKSGQT